MTLLLENDQGQRKVVGEVSLDKLTTMTGWQETIWAIRRAIQFVLAAKEVAT